MFRQTCFLLTHKKSTDVAVTSVSRDLNKNLNIRDSVTHRPKSLSLESYLSISFFLSYSQTHSASLLSFTPSLSLSPWMHLCRTEQVCQYFLVEVDQSTLQKDPLGCCYCSYNKCNQLCLLFFDKSSIPAWVFPVIMPVITWYWLITIYFPTPQGGQRSGSTTEWPILKVVFCNPKWKAITVSNWASIIYRFFPIVTSYSPN